MVNDWKTNTMFRYLRSESGNSFLQNSFSSESEDHKMTKKLKKPKRNLPACAVERERSQNNGTSPSTSSSDQNSLISHLVKTSQLLNSHRAPLTATTTSKESDVSCEQSKSSDEVIDPVESEVPTTICKGVDSESLKNTISWCFQGVFKRSVKRLLGHITV